MAKRSVTPRRVLASTLACLAVAGILTAAPVPESKEEVVKDRTSFIPTKIAPKPGKIIGLLVSDPAAVLARAGRGVESAQFAFSSGGADYDMIQIAGASKPLYSALKVRTGEKGDSAKVYESLVPATTDSVKERFGFSAPYALVELEINDGLGSPGGPWMVATEIKRLDDSKDFPLKVPEIVQQLRKKYDAWLKDQALFLDEKMAQAQKQYLQNAKPSGPRTTSSVMYLTWLPATQQLSARFLTRISDSAFSEATGPGADDGKKSSPAGFRHGTEFGIEFGMGYEVSRSGSIEKTLRLPAESFEHKILAPPRR